MANDKNHLYGMADVNFDQKKRGKITTQQQFSQFSASNDNTIIDIANRSQQPALQGLTKPPIGNPYNDTFGTIGLVTQVIFFDVYGSEYSFFEVNNNVDFGFAEIPQGKFVEFTLDIVVNTGGTPASVVLNFLQVLTPPVLDGNDGDHYILKFVGVNRADDTGVDTAGEQTLEYIGGTFSSGSGGGDVTFPIDFPELDMGNPVVNTIIDFANSTRHFRAILLSDDLDIDLQNIPPGTGALCTIYFTQDGVGGHVPTIPLLDNQDELENIDTEADSTTVFTIQTAFGQILGFTSGKEIFFGSGVADWANNIAINDVNFGTFDGLNIDRLLFDQGAGSPLSATQTGIKGDSGNNMLFNVPSSGTYNFQVNASGSPALIIAATLIASQTIIPLGTDTLGLELTPWDDVFTNDIHVNDNAFLPDTEMAGDIDLNTFDMFDIDKLAFMNFPSTGSSLNIGLSALGSGGFRANVLDSTGKFQITNENTVHFEFNAAADTSTFIDTLVSVSETFGSTAFSIVKFNGSTQLSEPTKIDFQIAGTTGVSLEDNGLVFSNNRFIAGLSQLGFSILGNIIEDDVNGMKFKTVPNDDFEWSDGTDIFATLDKQSLNLNDLYILVQDIAVPTVPTQNFKGQIFFNEATNRLNFQRRNDGNTAFEVIDLEGGGANTFLSNLTSPTAINQDLLPDTTGREFGSVSASWDGFFSNLFMTDNSQLPSTSFGEFERDGGEIGLFAQAFTVINDATGASGTANFVSYRNDPSPSDGDELGSLRFDGENNSGTREQFATILAGIKNASPSDGSGILALRVMANSFLTTALQIEGDDEESNQSFLTLSSLISSSLEFGTENAAGGVFNIGPAQSGIGAAIKIGIVVQDNSSYTAGSLGTLAMPGIIIVSNEITSAAQADGLFGDHAGSMGIVKNSAVTNPKLWIKIDDDWFFEEMTFGFAG